MYNSRTFCPVCGEKYPDLTIMSRVEHRCKKSDPVPIPNQTQTPNKYHCILCGVTVPLDKRERHEKTKKHQQKKLFI